MYILPSTAIVCNVIVGSDRYYSELERTHTLEEHSKSESFI